MSKRRAIALAGGGPAAAIVGAQHQEGQNLFSAIGCGACHTPVSVSKRSRHSAFYMTAEPWASRTRFFRTTEKRR